jgi:multisubunit Na+/H+ antiporter MnhG subunit
MIGAEEKRATLLVVYPLFKEEVYRRREQMMRWTAIGAGSLFTVILILVLTHARLSSGSRLLIMVAILLLTVTFASLILQQQRRHQQAKQTLIDLEQALGFFDDRAILSQGSLYPAHWQTDWKRDTTVGWSLILLGLLALTAILAAASAS